MSLDRPLTRRLGAVGVCLSAVAIAACGGGAPRAGTAQAIPKTDTGAVATLGVASTGLGSLLVDSQGRTLYLFNADNGPTSACTGQCAVAWPPLLAHGKPTVGKGARGSLIGTAKRSDGTEQVTYNGHPLYLFVKDKHAGQTTGEGVTAFGSLWYVLSAAGTQITSRPPSSSAGGGSGAGGAYGY